VPKGRFDISPGTAADLRFQNGVIYFLNAEGTNFWKVGYCGRESKVPFRIKELQTGCPFNLLLVAVIKQKSQSFEGKIHKLMKSHRMRGDWFFHNDWIDDFMDGWRIDGKRLP